MEGSPARKSPQPTIAGRLLLGIAQQKEGPGSSSDMGQAQMRTRKQFVLGPCSTV